MLIATVTARVQNVMRRSTALHARGLFAESPEKEGADNRIALSCAVSRKVDGSRDKQSIQ